MIQEKNAAVEKAVGFEAETAGLETSAKKFEKEVYEIQRKITKVEDELDITISKTKDTSEKLEIADKEAIDAELAAAALKRRVALLEEEADRTKLNFKKTSPNVLKLKRLL